MGNLWTPHDGASAHLRHGALSQVSGTETGQFKWASVTKLVTAYACLIAVEEGVVSLTDTSADLPGVTLAHLLAHAGGLAFDDATPIMAAESQRLYSNAGFRLAARLVERSADMRFSDYVAQGVLQPLGMTTVDWGDPAAGARGTILDLVTFAAELVSPTLLAKETLRRAVEPWWPNLDGFVPGFGMQRPCPWGLGFEIKGNKRPHWTGTSNSPETFGHFGQSGAMLAVDPVRMEAWCSVSPEPFGPWAKQAWPNMIDGTNENTIHR